MLCLTYNQKKIEKTNTKSDRWTGRSQSICYCSVPTTALHTTLIAVCTVGCCTVLLTTDTGCVATKQLITKWCLCRLAIAARMGSVMLVVLIAGQRQTLRTCIGALWVNLWFAANWYIVLWEVTNPQKPSSTLLTTNVGSVSVVMHPRR